MILPIRTSISPRRTPYANYALIIANVVIYFLQLGIDPQTGTLGFRQWVGYFMLDGDGRPYLWQFVSYAFLHGDIWHILGNMYFLYMFGNNVNDKVGNIAYVCFYLSGAVFSGVGHVLTGGGDVIGASGAVAAVTGAYLVLFPQTLITVLFWFFFIGTWEVPALYLILLKMILFDNIIAQRSPFVAYEAHLSGYAMGIVSMVVLLATGLLAGSSYDLWAMIKQWNRRRRYRDVVSSGYNPFTGRAAAKRVRVKEVIKSPAQKEKQERVVRLRSEISERLAQRNLPAATDIYLELMRLDSEQILPRQQLLDIANQLAGDGRHTESAQAYEQFLSHYRNYEHAEQIELMLGLQYSRYLNQREAAIKHLQAAAEKLTNPDQLKMCRDELARLQQ
ncbi:MAG: rhomboid family intramembrane serine protease [Phycisphaerales bacterium]|nr:MAG: rhomboid family intramembrane serine protease [Phycisphaerales bacterium]